MRYVSLICGLLFCTPLLAQNIIVSGTRFIYPANDKEISINLTNSGETPALAQVWLDEGDSTAAPENINSPFTISPPIVRIDGNQAQALRIKLASKPHLPTDRESLWWLNVLDIPASTGEALDDKTNVLELAIRSRFKFFWRPAGLGEREQAMKKLEVHADGKRAEIVNPTPFYVTIGSLTRGRGPELLKDAVMVAPKSRETVELTATLASGAALDLKEVNDYGGINAVRLITR